MIIGDLTDATNMRLKSISLYHSVQAVADAFSDARLGIVVICDDAARAVGLVSTSDLVRHMARGGSIETQIAEIMTRPKGDANGAPYPQPLSYRDRFTGRNEHRTLTSGIGHNLPQEAPEAFAEAIDDLVRWTTDKPSTRGD